MRTLIKRIRHLAQKEESVNLRTYVAKWSLSHRAVRKKYN